MKRYDPGLALFIVLVITAGLCGCADDDCTSPTTTAGGFGMIRIEAGYDFETASEVPYGDSGVDLAMMTYGGHVACWGDSCEVGYSISIATPFGGRVSDLGVVALDDVQDAPASGYAPELVVHLGAFVPGGGGAYDLSPALEDRLLAHVLVVLGPDGARYKLVILAARVLFENWHFGPIWLEFRWEAF